MNRLAAGLTLFAVVCTATVSSANADPHEVALVKVASQLGFLYGYLGPEDAVSLSRPGVTIVIRPGEKLFDVNDRTEAMDGPAPHFYHSDVFVSDAMYKRLRMIAARYPALPQAVRPMVVLNPNAAGAAISGSISGLKIAQTPGEQDLYVSGKSPANLPVTITLSATFSNEIADTVLTRQQIVAEADGTFKSVVPVASGLFRGAILTVAVTSVPGIKPASTSIQLKPVNDKVVVPADQDPKNVR